MVPVQGEAFLCVVAVPEGDVRCFVGLPGPMAMLTVDFWAMVGLSPRSLSCRNAGLGRELGLQLAMERGPLYFFGDSKGPGLLLCNKMEMFPIRPLCTFTWAGSRCGAALPRGGWTAESWTVTRLWAHRAVLPRSRRKCRGVWSLSRAWAFAWHLKPARASEMKMK